MVLKIKTGIIILNVDNVISFDFTPPKIVLKNCFGRQNWQTDTSGSFLFCVKNRRFRLFPIRKLLVVHTEVYLVCSRRFQVGKYKQLRKKAQGCVSGFVDRHNDHSYQTGYPPTTVVFDHNQLRLDIRMIVGNTYFQMIYNTYLRTSLESRTFQIALFMPDDGKVCLSTFYRPKQRFIFIAQSK